MSTIVSAVIGISVSVICVSSILSPTIAEATAEGAALAEYSGLLGAIVVMTIVGVLMIAVSLISTKR